jgi:hypothetical protein
LLHTLFLIVLVGWAAFIATTPTNLKRVHKIIGQTPLYFACAWSLRIGHFHTARLVQIGNR